MWTSKNRGRYDRSALRYPSDLTDDEWALIEPLIPPARRGGNKRHVDEREVMSGIMYVLSTGPVAGDPERPTPTQHGARLSRLVELRLGQRIVVVVPPLAGGAGRIGAFRY